MQSSDLQHVRRQDFRLKMVLHPDDPVLATEICDATFRVKPNFLAPRLVLEVYQPIAGSVHSTLVGICKRGLHSLSIHTLIPGRPDMDMLEECGHLAYHYTEGKVIEQETVMSKDLYDGDDFMVHLLLLEFLRFDVMMNEWDELETEDNVVHLSSGRLARSSNGPTP